MATETEREIPAATYFQDIGALQCAGCGRLFYSGDEITMKAADEHRIALLCDCGAESLLSDDRLLEDDGPKIKLDS